MRRRKNRIDTDFASFFKNASPSGVPADLQSGVKNVLTYLGSADLQSAAKECAFSFCWGITNPPVLIGRTFFYGGFQIRRDAWRETFFFDAWREKCTLYL